MPNLQGKIELIKQAQVDIKNAIIDKGVTPTGNISTYADAIDNIVTPNNQTKTVTENGVVRYDTGYTGLEQVTVNVNQSVQNKNITTNGTYTADSGYVGLGVVTVDVSPDVIAKTITANGTYNAEDDDVEGYSSVTVNVPSPIDDLIDGSITSVDTAVTSIKGGAFKDCEDLDTVILRSNTVVDLSDDSIFENTPIADKTGDIYVPSGLIDTYKSNNKSNNPNDFVQATQNSNLVKQSNWRGLAYGNNIFVAISYGNSLSSPRWGYFSTSSDGINWSEPSTMLSIYEQNAITFGNNLFVCITIDGIVLTSSDGTNWTRITGSSLGNHDWNGLTYGNGKFVAIGTSGYISTSQDGETWTTPTQSSGLMNGLNDPMWIDITYDGTKFVALEQYDGYGAVSFNGTNWMRTDAQLGTTSDWKSLVYSNDGFIAISKTGYISISIDGVIWTTPVKNSNLGEHDWQDIIVANGLHVLGKSGYVSYTNSKYNFLSIS